MRNFKGSRNTFDQSRRYSSFGINASSLNYFGDLAPKPGVLSTDISFTRPAFGATYSYRFGPRYTVQADFFWGTLRGSDYESADPGDPDQKPRYIRNLQFRNRIKELSITAVVDLYKNESSYITRVELTPYAFLGISVFHHNPKGFVGNDSGLPEAGTWVALQPLGTEGQNSTLAETDVNYGIKPYSKIQIGIPFGIGARYKLNQAMDLSFEIGTRFLFTDYIDDVSANYVDLDKLPSDLSRYMSDRSTQTEAITGATRDDIPTERISYNGYSVIAGYGQENEHNMRGGVNDNDIYWVTTLRLTYIIGGKLAKAKFR
ncbi:MAG: DUF6089 family protein [Cyclobacteriaceae bacterium]|nr:DUF6089 family protein [Cyclobacteriaceae bacterium]